MSTDEVPCVLVVGQRPDPHIEAVSSVLRNSGVRVVNCDRHGDGYSLFDLSSAGVRHASVTDGCGTVSLDAVTGVWWRVKPSAAVEFSGGTGTVEEAFRWREWQVALSSLSALTPTATWVNPHPANLDAACKPRQLILAQRLGFAIPDTIVTNSAAAVLALFDSHERVVYKTLSSFLIPPDEIIYTSEVTREDVLVASERIALAPGIFQARIEKLHELRVTVVDERIFAVEIDSQSAAETSTDWRRNQYRSMYRSVTIDANTELNMKRFMVCSGIRYGAFDFIVTPQGELVFVECNPGGQWLWLEHHTGLDISQAMAELLTEGHCYP